MPRRPANITSYSEMSMLASCEQKWSLRYREHLKGDDSQALQLGRLVDIGVSALLKGEDWYGLLQRTVAEEGADWSYVVLQDIEGPASTADWLIRRYRDYYGLPPQVVATQLDLTAKIPGTAQIHRAIIDELWSVDGELWVVERKTYGRNDRLQLVDVDPQLTLNLWVARENGYDCKGIVFDGIYTYRWKPEKPTQGDMMNQILADPLRYGEMWKDVSQKVLREKAKALIEESPGIDRPAADSFDRMWLDRTDEHIAEAIKEVKGGLQRRNALRRGARPMRNIGPSCRSCAQRPTCFERLGFPESVLDIELDEA